MIDISRQIEVLDVGTGERLWAYDLPSGPGFENAFLTRAYFADGGDTVVAGAHWQPEREYRIGGPVDPEADPPRGVLGAYVLDARTWKEIERIDLGRCGGIVVGVTDTHLLARVMAAEAAGASDGAALDRRCDWRGAPTLGLDLVDRRDGSRRQLTADSGGLDLGFAVSADGRIAAYDDSMSRDVVVLDLVSGRELLRLPQAHEDLADVERPMLVLAASDDGARIMLGVNPVQIWDVAEASLVSSFHGHGGTASFGRFSADGATAYTTGGDGALRQWDVRTGQQVRSFPGTANGPVAVGADGLLAAGDYNGRNMTVLDTGVRAEVAAAETCGGARGQESPMGTLRGGPNGLVLTTACRRDTVTQTWLPGAEEFDRVIPGATGLDIETSPDGRLFVRQDGSGGTSRPPYTIGGLTVRDVRTGKIVTRLEGTCTYRVTTRRVDTGGCGDFPKRPFAFEAWRIGWSPDGAMIAAIDGDRLVVWEAATGKIRHVDTSDEGLYDVVFSPSSDELVASTSGGELRRLSTSTWDVLHSSVPDLGLPFAIGLAGYTADGSSLLVVTGEGLQVTGSTIGWLDAETLALERQRTLIHDGSVGSAALHRDGTRLATAGTDGLARVWDVETGEMVHEADLGEGTPLHGVAWVGERDLALAPRDGNLLVVTTDPAELLQIVRSSLTRGFTEVECDRFGFAAGCPSLGELRGGTPSAEAAALAGTYTLSWGEDEVEDVFRTAFEEIIGSELDDASAAEIDYLRDTYVGEYTWTFDGVGHVLERAGDADPICVGSYRVREGRLALGGERGEFCEFTQDFLDAQYTLYEDRLQIQADGSRGFVEDRIAWTSKPLVRQ